MELTPRPGEIFYYIQSDAYELSWMGIAYEVQDDPHKVKAVATAVSGSEQRVRSMLRTKVKRLGLTPP